MKCFYLMVGHLLLTRVGADVAACTSRFCSTADADAAVCGAINEGSTTPALRYNSKCDAACHGVLNTGPCPPQDVACPSGIEGCHMCTTTDDGHSVSTPRPPFHLHCACLAASACVFKAIWFDISSSFLSSPFFSCLFGPYKVQLPTIGSFQQNNPCHIYASIAPITLSWLPCNRCCRARWSLYLSMDTLLWIFKQIYIRISFFLHIFPLLSTLLHPASTKPTCTFENASFRLVDVR